MLVWMESQTSRFSPNPKKLHSNHIVRPCTYFVYIYIFKIWVHPKVFCFIYEFFKFQVDCTNTISVDKLSVIYYLKSIWTYDSIYPRFFGDHVPGNWKKKIIIEISLYN